MSLKFTFTAAVAAGALMASSAFAGGIMAQNPYARASTPNAPTGAAFMVLMNHSDQEDTLLGVRSDVAQRVELHTHIDKGDGVLQMTKIEGGVTIPAGGSHVMKRGGDHVMLMGLKETLIQGEMITVTFEFEKAGDVDIEVLVDHERRAVHGEGHSGHSTHSNHSTD